MAANQAPIFVLTPKCPSVTLAAANTARDGSGTLGTLFTAGTNGSRLDFVTFTSAQATPAASSAMVGRIFLTDTSGLNPVLIAEVVLATVTPSNTAAGQQQTVAFSNGLILASGQIVKVAISVYAGVQDQYQVIARGGDY